MTKTELKQLAAAIGNSADIVVNGVPSVSVSKVFNILNTHCEEASAEMKLLDNREYVITVTNKPKENHEDR